LLLYLHHPNIRISNADAERIIKPFVIGRKTGSLIKPNQGQKLVQPTTALLKHARLTKLIHINIYDMYYPN